eukprot:TRINITY_DN3228_c0_g1_i4.p1 TRINITY_DN3228_c0_g1~~TRINITY_DN3228_c0_g1_i4.p1  ORF type:complete len:593 (-),score=88.38 TRINITY_DN3228_c0_g1_i4:135-1745(-)
MLKGTELISDTLQHNFQLPNDNFWDLSPAFTFDFCWNVHKRTDVKILESLKRAQNLILNCEELGRIFCLLYEKLPNELSKSCRVEVVSLGGDNEWKGIMLIDPTAWYDWKERSIKAPKYESSYNSKVSSTQSSSSQKTKAFINESIQLYTLANDYCKEMKRLDNELVDHRNRFDLEGVERTTEVLCECYNSLYCNEGLHLNGCEEMINRKGSCRQKCNWTVSPIMVMDDNEKVILAARPDKTRDILLFGHPLGNHFKNIEMIKTGNFWRICLKIVENISEMSGEKNPIELIGVNLGLWETMKSIDPHLEDCHGQANFDLTHRAAEILSTSRKVENILKGRLGNPERYYRKNAEYLEKERLQSSHREMMQEQLKNLEDRMEGTMDRIEGTMDRMEGTMERMEGTMERIEGTMENIKGEMKNIRTILEKICFKWEINTQNSEGLPKPKDDRERYISERSSAERERDHRRREHSCSDLHANRRRYREYSPEGDYHNQRPYYRYYYEREDRDREQRKLYSANRQSGSESDSDAKRRKRDY